MAVGTLSHDKVIPVEVVDTTVTSPFTSNEERYVPEVWARPVLVVVVTVVVPVAAKVLEQP